MSRLIQLNLLVLLWSLTAILAEMISLGPPALVFWRTAIASLLFIGLCVFKKRPLLQISRKHLTLSLVSGAILGLHWLCFFGAVAISNVSVGLAGFAASSLFAALLEPALQKKRLDFSKIGLSLLVVVGIALIAGAKTEVPNAGLGLAIALLGALLAAVCSILNKILVDEALPGPTLMAYQIPASCLVAWLAMMLVPSVPWQTPQRPDWLPLLILAVACTFAAYLWFAELLKEISAYTVNLAINFEPVYGMLMAALFFQEYKSLTPLFYAGTLTILAANLLHAKQMKKEEKAASASGSPGRE